MSPGAADFEVHRPALVGHCYRMLGSIVDADDAVQETMVRAWRHRSSFEGRASLKTWLHRIATNVCLDAIADRRRRAWPTERSAGVPDDELVQEPREHWIEPIPDDVVIPRTAAPEERVLLQESIRLAFVAALQTLPAKQRAVLLMTEVLDWSAAETAAALDTTVAAVNSALQRARATVARRPRSTADVLSADQKALVERYVAALESFDVDTLASLLHEDVAFSMPPYTLWLEGSDSVRAWLFGRGSVCRESRLVPTAANGSPAFGHYHALPDGHYEPWGLVVLELDGPLIAGWTTFLDTQTLFPRFGLPPSLPAAPLEKNGGDR